MFQDFRISARPRRFCLVWARRTFLIGICVHQGCILHLQVTAFERVSDGCLTFWTMRNVYIGCRFTVTGYSRRGAEWDIESAIDVYRAQE